MRRVLCLILCLALLLNGAAAFARELQLEEGMLPVDCVPVRLLSSEGSGISLQTVTEAAGQALSAHHPGDNAILSVPFLCHTNRVALSDGRTAWICSLFSQVDETPIEAVVTIDEASGTLLRYEENNTGWFRQTQERWESLYGPYGTWPLETQVLYDVLYCLEITHATLPEGLLPEYSAYELALQAAGLSESRDTLHCRRALVIDLYAVEPAAQYVWMITICLGDEELFQVNVSAVDAHVLNVFDLTLGVG